MSSKSTGAKKPVKHALERNDGIAYDEGLFKHLRVNLSATERRVASMINRRSVKKAHQAAWLLKAIRCIDLTTLSGDDTQSNVLRLCHKARNPVRQDILDDLGVGDMNIHTGAVCVYHNWVATAVEALAGTGIPVAAVSTGFPAGQSPMPIKLQEIRESVKDGAEEIDIVISRELVLAGKWQELYEEVKAYREACGDAHMKSILATGELATLTNVAKASWVCMMAGSDFIKTSTGKEPVNATLAVGLTMVRTIREYHELTGLKVGFKPAGGVKTAKQSTQWLSLIKEELGDEWLNPDLFRFGASSLLSDIERQLEHYTSGSYSAFNRHPLG